MIGGCIYRTIVSKLRSDNGRKKLLGGIILSGLYLAVVPLVGVFFMKHVFVSPSTVSEVTFYDDALCSPYRINASKKKEAEKQRCK